MHIAAVGYNILINGAQLASSLLGQVEDMHITLGPKKTNTASIEIIGTTKQDAVFYNDKLPFDFRIAPNDSVEITLGENTITTVYKGKITTINARSKEGKLVYILQCRGPVFEAKKQTITVVYGDNLVGFNIGNEIGGKVTGELIIQGSNLVVPGSKVLVQGFWQDLKELTAKSIQHQVVDGRWLTTVFV